MFEYIKWITVGVISYAVMSTMGFAEEKKSSVIDDKIKSAQIWAIGFGADIKQQQIKNLKLTKEALKQDWSWSEGGRFTYHLKNAWEDAKYSVRRDSVTVRGYWQTIADAIGAKAGAVK